MKTHAQKTRDTQRQKIYNSEQDVWNAWSDDGNTRLCFARGEKDFDSIEGVEAYVREIEQSQWWADGKASSEPVTVEYCGRSKRGHAWTDLNKIVMPEISWRKWYVIHEMAHIAMSFDGIADHGPEWTAWYVQGIRELMGAQTAARLATALWNRNVEGALVPGKYLSEDRAVWERDPDWILMQYEEDDGW